MRKSAFTLIQILVTSSIMVVGSGMLIFVYGAVKEQAKLAIVEDAANTLNKAIEVYELHSGDISGLNATQVIAELKKNHSSDILRKSTALGELIQSDFNLEATTSANTEAVVTYSNGRFSYAKDGAGFLITRDGTAAPKTTDTEVANLTYNPNDTGWIWKDSDSAATGPKVINPIDQQLKAPKFLYSGNVPVSKFPLNNIMQYGENPVGTVYHYTTDGSIPTSGSPIWQNPEITLGDLPPQFRAIATHPASNWSDSPVAQTTIIARLEVEYSREDGTQTTSFTLGDVIGGTNKIVLSVPGVPSSNYEIRYTGDGSEPTTTSDLYLTSFHFPALYWPKSGRPLKVRAFATEMMVLDSPTLSRDLMAVSTKLPNPTFDIDPTSGPISEGDIIRASNSLMSYSRIKSEIGETIPSELATFDEEITIPSP